MELGLILVRFVHYGASLVLFGLVLFPLYAYPPVTNRNSGSRALALSLSVSLLVLISGILWFVSVATSMTEAEMSWETARFMVTETSFGAVETEYRFVREGNVSAFYWIDRGLGFAISAAASRDRLLPIVDAVYHQSGEPKQDSK